MVYTWNFHPDLVASAREQGVRGYLSKALPARELVAALEAVHAGEVVVSEVPGRARPANGLDWPGRDEGLTDRESEILALITQGLSNAEVAALTYLSPNTVKSYIRVGLPQDRRREPDAGGAVGRRPRLRPGPPPHRPLARRPLSRRRRPSFRRRLATRPSVPRMADDGFEVPRLAQLYDPLDPDRSDLDVYAAIVDELGARSVLDVGCGTGTFALLLAARGLEVIGVDPAEASLDVARGKPGADAVRWVHGDATSVGAVGVDVATMTGNVAQVFVTDEEWAETLDALHAALAPGGHLVFETRVPEREAWREWTRERTHEVTDVDGVGPVETRVATTGVVEPATVTVACGSARRLPDQAGWRSCPQLDPMSTQPSPSTAYRRTASRG